MNWNFKVITWKVQKIKKTGFHQPFDPEFFLIFYLISLRLLELTD